MQLVLRLVSVQALQSESVAEPVLQAVSGLVSEQAWLPVPVLPLEPEWLSVLVQVPELFLELEQQMVQVQLLVQVKSEQVSSLSLALKPVVELLEQEYPWVQEKLLLSILLSFRSVPALCCRTGGRRTFRPPIR